MDSTPVSSQDVAQAILLWKLFMISQAVVSLMGGILAIVAFFRRSPPLDQVIRGMEKAFNDKLSDYAPRTDVIAMEIRLGARMDGLHSSFKEERAQTILQLSDLNKGLARIEGWIDGQKKDGP